MSGRDMGKQGERELFIMMDCADWFFGEKK